MKKTLIAILAALSFGIANAASNESQMTASTTAAESAVAFNNAQIKCGDKILKNGDSVDTLAGICKSFEFGKGKAVFVDDNSNMVVLCKAKRGDIILASCQPKPPKNN